MDELQISIRKWGYLPNFNVGLGRQGVLTVAHVNTAYQGVVNGQPNPCWAHEVRNRRAFRNTPVPRLQASGGCPALWGGEPS